MFIRNANLRKSLGMGRLLEADTGANGGSGTGADGGNGERSRRRYSRSRRWRQVF